MSRIPKYFHFVFGLKKQNTPFHLMYYICLESCIQVNKPETIYFYYVHEPFGPYWELIKPKLTPVKVSPNSFVKEFKYSEIGRKRLSYAHHADFIRLEKLLEKGGVYADMDTLFVQKLPSRLFNESFVLGREPDIYSESTGKMERSLCNAFIMAEPNSTFAQKWLDNIQSHFDGSWSNHSTVLPQKLSLQFPAEIHIEPQKSFYRFVWTKEDLQNLFEGSVEDLDEVYSIHLWQHLWFSKWNRLSTFSGGQLTKEYIRSGATTYAKLAKPFLPTKHEMRVIRKVPAIKVIRKKIGKSFADAGFYFSRIAAKIQSMIKVS